MNSAIPAGIERRLERLEAKHKPEKLSRDELNIVLLMKGYRLVAEYGDCALEPRSAEIIAWLREHIVKTEAAIIRAEANRANPPDSVHAENYRRDADGWRARHGTEYIPPIVDCNGFDHEWHVPNIMQRRAALREIPEIAALLKQGISKLEVHA
jgi:hypothetical protein